MSRIILLPRRYRLIGWLLLLPSAVVTYLVIFYEYEFAFLDLYQRSDSDFFTAGTENFTNELAYIGLILALFFIGFARLKVEDEYTQRLRLDACLWAFYLHGGLLILSTLLFYSDDFLWVMIFNLGMPFVIYVIRFYYLVYRANA
jgi:hypothetical protein